MDVVQVVSQVFHVYVTGATGSLDDKGLKGTMSLIILMSLLLPKWPPDQVTQPLDPVRLPGDGGSLGTKCRILHCGSKHVILPDDLMAGVGGIHLLPSGGTNSCRSPHLWCIIERTRSGWDRTLNNRPISLVASSLA